MENTMSDVEACSHLDALYSFLLNKFGKPTKTYRSANGEKYEWEWTINNETAPKIEEFKASHRNKKKLLINNIKKLGFHEVDIRTEETVSERLFIISVRT